ncbi:MAG: hypothetical protein P1V35_11630, partial [Planctomycetota bacterium]|nr:hypothetical protein [Planctomycetota bacterium]
MRIPLILFLLLAVILALYLSLAGGASVSANGLPGLQATEEVGPAGQDGQALRDPDSTGPIRGDVAQTDTHGLRQAVEAALLIEDTEPSIRVLVVDPKGEPMPCYPVRMCIKNSADRFRLVGPRQNFHVLADALGIARIPVSVLWEHASATEPLFVASGFTWQFDAFTAL